MSAIRSDVFATVRKKTDAALQNEAITRERVDRIEAFLCRSLWGRLKWVLFGK